MAKTERSHYARRYLLHTMLSTDSRNIEFICMKLEPRKTFRKIMVCRTESAGQKKTQASCTTRVLYKGKRGYV